MVSMRRHQLRGRRGRVGRRRPRQWAWVRIPPKEGELRKRANSWSERAQMYRMPTFQNDGLLLFDCVSLAKSIYSVWPSLGFCRDPGLCVVDNEQCGMKSGIGLREYWEVVI